MQQRQQDRTGAGAGVGNAQQSGRIASGTQDIERGLDNRFRVGSRHQRCRRKLEIQPPEFLAAEQARDRFAADAAVGEILQSRGFECSQSSLGVGDHSCEIEPRHGADHQPRIEFGRFDCSTLKMRRQIPARRIDGETCEGDVHRQAAEPCAASCAA